MKRISINHLILALSVVVITTKSSFAQITTDNSPGISSLIYKLGLKGNISNIKFIGDPTARGLFNGVNSNIGLNSGIILSTGSIDSATGPNKTPSDGSCMFYKSGTDFGMSGDADLDVI